MGLAKVLLGRGSKETGLSKCARIDSLGLTRRRMAAKAAQEELGTDAADVEATGQDGDVAPTTQGLLYPQSESEAIFMRFMSRQHIDSLRIYRRRFRERASLDLPNGRSKSALPDTGVRFCSVACPGTGDGQGEDNDLEDDGSGDDKEPGNGLISYPGNTARRHVCFRRASDGEYLTTTCGHKGHESGSLGFPSALKAVQLKAERLFRRITANFTESHITRSPRSETPSRGVSPVRPSRSAATSRAASATRASSSWALGLRNRSVDLGNGDATPTAAATAADADGVDGGGAGRLTAAVRQRRGKRQSAPGELFLASVGIGAGGAQQEPVSPQLSSAVGRPRALSVTAKDLTLGRAVSECATIGGGASPTPIGSPGLGLGRKSRNWLARISRSLTSSSNVSKATTGAAAAEGPAAAVATQPASPPCNDGGAGIEALTGAAEAVAAKDQQDVVGEGGGSGDSNGAELAAPQQQSTVIIETFG